MYLFFNRFYLFVYLLLVTGNLQISIHLKKNGQTHVYPTLSNHTRSDIEQRARSDRLPLGTHFPKRFSFCDVHSTHFHPQHYSLTLFADCPCHLSPNAVAFQDSSRHPLIRSD
jgi:hypothetical protein